MIMTWYLLTGSKWEMVEMVKLNLIPKNKKRLSIILRQPL